MSKFKVGDIVFRKTKLTPDIMKVLKVGKKYTAQQVNNFDVYVPGQTWDFVAREFELHYRLLDDEEKADAV